MATTEQLADYARAFVASAERAGSLIGPLSEDQFNWKPDPDSWSVAECIDHLNRVARGYVPAMSGTLSQADRGASGPFRYGWLGRKFIESLSPESRPLKTAGAMKPGASGTDFSRLDKQETLDEFLALTDSFVQIVDEAKGVDLARVKMRSPFLWLLRLPIGAFIEALGQHAHRHLDQAERVVGLSGFPQPQ